VPDGLTENHTIPSASSAAEDARISNVHALTLTGDINAGTDLSGVVVVGDYMVLGADEGHRLQVLRRCEQPDCWCLEHSGALAKRDQETDTEAITYADGYVYVTGSHSARRRLTREDLSVRRNRERLLDVRQEESRNRLYRVPFDSHSGKLGKPESIDLTKRLRKDPLLHRFYGVPSKENGIDIEGLAYRDGRLAVGFRGPVLRDNFVPVMHLDFDRPKKYRLSFVRLEGQGIRDLVAVRDGYLILSGPINDAPGSFRLWWWDGNDQVPGKDRDITDSVLLGDVSTAGGAKAEGLALLEERDGLADVVVIYETSRSTQAVGMRLKLPR
jgi:hypothetical protein